MRRTTAPAVLLAAFMMSCATTRLDTSRPLEIDSSGFGTTYHQGIQSVGVPDLEQKLAAHPVAGPKMDGYQPKKLTAFVLASAGGVLIGRDVTCNLLTSGRKDWALSVVGASIVAFALPFGFAADRQLRSAAEVYNGSLRQTQPRMLGDVVPYIAVQPAPAGRRHCVAGFTMPF